MSFNEIFFQPLLQKKIQLEERFTKNESQILKIAWKYQLSGFLIGSFKFSKSQKNLFNQLKLININFIKKYFLMKCELIKIAKHFDAEGIEFVVTKGMALKLLNIYKNNERQFRDIDILVRKDDLKNAYDILKKIGYVYNDPQTRDAAKYLGEMHQIPAMVNNKNVFVELHHRLTLPKFFKDCPITDSIFSEYQTVDSIKLPTYEYLIAHALYHGTIHHNFDNGPIFLFDIQKILINRNVDLDKLMDICIKMNLEDKINNTLKLIEINCNYNSASNELENHINKIFNKKDFYEQADEIKYYILQKPKNFKSRKIKLRSITKGLKYYSYKYQISMLNPRLYTLVLKYYFNQR